MSYTPGEFIAIEAELIVACEYAKTCIENIDAQIAHLPEE